MQHCRVLLQNTEVQAGGCVEAILGGAAED